MSTNARPTQEKPAGSAADAAREHDASRAPLPSPPTHGYTGEKDALLKRLRRIEGQVRGIEKMLQEDRYCIDIITQISAVGTALEAVAFKILDDHVNHCVAGAMSSGDPQLAAEKSRELLDAVHRFARMR